MKSLLRRLRYACLTMAAGSLFFLDGCGLSDQQLATIWQSVIQSSLTSVVTSSLTQATQ